VPLPGEHEGPGPPHGGPGPLLFHCQANVLLWN